MKHERHSIRAHCCDYAWPGMYFVTVCASERRSLFGEICNNVMEVNDLGRVVLDCWNEIPLHFPNVALDAFALMPNHVHGIVIINTVGATHASPLPRTARGPAQSSLGAIVGSFKAAVSKRAGVAVWQRNYFEHIIRDERGLAKIQEYIENNPSCWHSDRENPHRTGTDEFDRWLVGATHASPPRRQS